MSSGVSFPARDVEGGTSQEPSEPARVLDFRKPDVPANGEEREKPSSNLTRNQKMRRIVESAVERMNDDQLADLITAVEKITGCFSQTGGYSE
jgi:hypothetical protein